MTDKESAAPVTAVSAPKRKRGNRILWIAGPAVVAVGALYFYLTSGRFVSTDNAYVQADHVTIAPQVGGRVVEVLVRENQAVKAGDVLFRIDAQPLEIAVARSTAQLESVRSILDAARAGYHSAQADLRSAEADVQHAQQQYERQKELRAKGLVAQQSLEDAANTVASTRGKRDSDIAALSKAQNMLGGLPSTPDEQLAGFKLAQAQLAQAKLDLEHATVRAPVDGIVGKEDLQVGEFLAMGQAAMPLIANSLWVEANFKETDLTHVFIGQPATVEVDTYPGRKWSAHVASISPASGAEYAVLPAQNATGNWVKIVQRIPIKFALDAVADEQATLRAGMSAEVEIDTGKQNAKLSRWFGKEAPQQQVALTH